MPAWNKETRPESVKGERAPYQRRSRENYLNFETKTRDGKEVARYWYVRLPIPAALRRARRYGARTAIVRYLGTASETEARKLAPAAVAAIRAEFAAMEREGALTAEAARQIQAFETWRAHTAMVADPINVSRAEDMMAQTLKEDARAALAKLGLDPSERNLNAAMDAIYLGKVGAAVLWDRGITPPEPTAKASTPAPIAFATAIELYKVDPLTDLQKSSRNNLSIPP